MYNAWADLFKDLWLSIWSEIIFCYLSRTLLFLLLLFLADCMDMLSKCVRIESPVFSLNPSFDCKVSSILFWYFWASLEQSIVTSPEDITGNVDIKEDICFEMLIFSFCLHRYCAPNAQLHSVVWSLWTKPCGPYHCTKVDPLLHLIKFPAQLHRPN